MIDINDVDEEKILNKAESLAKRKFSRGYNCAEAVFKTVIEIIEEDLEVELGLPPNVVKLATGFGEGIGRYGKTCGALSGGTMALGALFGVNNPLNVSFKERSREEGCYKVFNKLASEFEKEFGSTQCKEIINVFNEVYSRKHLWFCLDLTAKTAREVIEIIFLVEKKGISGLEFQKEIDDIFD